MINFKLVDNLTNYLDALGDRIKDIGYREKFLDDAAKELVEIVDEVIPRMNPNLRYSGLNESFWEHHHDEGKSVVEVIYTGFTGEGKSEPDDVYVFWEFGKYHRGGYSDILGRDYAYYIEFGKDRFAPNSKVKAPDRVPSLYLTGSVLEMEDLIEYHAEEYLNKILKK